MAKIVWVHDDFEGPVNGIVEYNGEKVWFSRVQLPYVVSSTDVPVPEQDIRTYTLTRISSSDLERLEHNHEDYCEKIGAPVLHGDCYKIRRRPLGEKADFSKIIPEGEEKEVEATKRPLSNVKTFIHTMDVNNLSGEYIDTIPESEFSNYSVPRRVEMD